MESKLRQEVRVQHRGAFMSWLKSGGGLRPGGVYVREGLCPGGFCPGGFMSYIPYNQPGHVPSKISKGVTHLQMLRLASFSPIAYVDIRVQFCCITNMTCHDMCS